MHLVVIGGGAAGFFGAVTAAALNPSMEITIIERGAGFLQKVKISGGGRCNVTHACFDPRDLVRFYPRGGRELPGPFTRFGPVQTIEWFGRHGVVLKTESDGRMFPVTDQSQTIIDCLVQTARKYGVHIKTSCRVEGFQPRPDGRWEVVCGGQPTIIADKLLVTTGSSESIWGILAQLGHTIVPPVPSLFTFNTKDTRLRDLAGVSVPAATVTVPALKLMAQGPLLITHWGLSGPAVLKLSAWGARVFHGVNYNFSLIVNWLGEEKPDRAMSSLQQVKAEQAKKQIHTHAQFGLPLRLWQHLALAAGIPPEMRWADATKKHLTDLAGQLTAGEFAIRGKSTFKEEFVTAGGVDLKEVNFKTFESKRLPGLYFAGEVLDIDAVTGGFNFQAAWTGGWIAGNSISGIYD